MTRLVQIAVVQSHPCLGDLDANLASILMQIKDSASKGANFIIFPELALTGYNPEMLGERLLCLACSAKDEPIQKLAQAAGENGVYLAVGFIEKRSLPGVVYNSIVMCDPDGSVRTYAKSHLFSAENLYFRPGSKLKVWRTKFGAVGPLICMDIGYPEVPRILGLQGAEFYIAPSCWIDADADIWPVHLQARALDNLAFVIGCNRVGVEGNLNFIGNSMLVDPRGRILARLGDQEDVLYATIDLDEVETARRRALHWTLRRPEMYKPICKPLK